MKRKKTYHYVLFRLQYNILLCLSQYVCLCIHFHRIVSYPLSMFCTFHISASSESERIRNWEKSVREKNIAINWQYWYFSCMVLNINEKLSAGMMMLFITTQSFFEEFKKEDMLDIQWDEMSFSSCINWQQYDKINLCSACVWLISICDSIYSKREH